MIRQLSGLDTTGVATNGAARDAYDAGDNGAAGCDATARDTDVSFGSKRNFAGRSPYVGAGLQTPVSSPRPASPAPLDALSPCPRPDPSSSGQSCDLARKALVDHAHSQQALEQWAPAFDVAVMADIQRRALNLRYARTFEQNHLSPLTSGTYITRAGFTASQQVYAEQKYANEDWSRLVNDDNP
ncbi:hypothetical protein LMG29542_08393 [Paraburkholderia humisilvae]|uniref:Uncharacterized protein n=2 Tax=Paraburkholderia humisilvae TaxID=627669 RepID=A0A6J5FB29_9BURK|nr:hypothetical protein LMG29542_08393 [Paraburkholderia humisilvae]